MVAPHDGNHVPRFDLVAPGREARLVDQRLEHLGRLALEEPAHVVDRRAIRRVHLVEITGGGPVERPRALADRALLDVGGIVAAVGLEDRVLAGVTDDHELVGRRTADGAGLGFDHLVGQPAAIEDPAVRPVHPVVCLVEPPGPVEGQVERVRVLHDELAAAKHAEARPGLVAVLRLDLIEGQRKLSVALDVGPHRLGDDLLVGRGEGVAPPGPVLELEEALAILEVALGVGEDLDRLQGGHEQLGRAGRVHLLTDDLDRLVKRPPARRQVGVEAGPELADQPRPQHEPVRGNLRLGGVLPGGGNQRLRPQGGHGKGKGRSDGATKGSASYGVGTPGSRSGGRSNPARRTRASVGPEGRTERSSRESSGKPGFPLDLT